MRLFKVLGMVAAIMFSYAASEAKANSTTDLITKTVIKCSSCNVLLVRRGVLMMFDCF